MLDLIINSICIFEVIEAVSLSEAIEKGLRNSRKLQLFQRRVLELFCFIDHLKLRQVFFDLVKKA